MFTSRLHFAGSMAAIMIATLVAYFQVLGHEFVDYDDGLYVTANPHVKAGLTWGGVKWAFTTSETGTWQPLTLLSHMLDVEVFGLKPGGHHGTSLLFHLLNTILIATWLLGLTNRPGPSLFVAGAFALHPLHVESVAWVSERKDVLSTLFWLLAMTAYTRFVRTRGLSWYAATTGSLVLGLMAKPMLVTLPFVLLLIDYRPLDRFQFRVPLGRTRRLVGVTYEKLPWMLLCGLSALITLTTQRATESIISVENLPLSLRIENALVSYVAYLGKFVWPANLAFHYPFPFDGIPAVKVTIAIAILVAITIAAAVCRKGAPFFLVGWLWYLGTLIPVIGLVHVGTQAMADRYSYIPSIGLFMIPAWGVPQLWRRFIDRRPSLNGWVSRYAIGCSACILLAVWAYLTAMQAAVWRDSLSLFQHAAHATADNELANTNTGMVLNNLGRHADALPYLIEAARIRPDYSETHFYLASTYQTLGLLDDAIVSYRRGLTIDATNEKARNNLGLCLLAKGKPNEAVNEFSEVIRRNPESPATIANLGAALLQAGRSNEAYRCLTSAAEKFPRNPEIRTNLGIVYANMGDVKSALREFERALELEPGNVTAQTNARILRSILVNE